ncbi:unnamed protein product [Owenia fusiformis]|uniref:EF-hand domain-containing protein n=1 Tax=Owenia fusiformis TaxID=6347 RepID=A0A8S4P408_OWEFU|nr:unnamed protein product [Owenia fusiformis]
MTQISSTIGAFCLLVTLSSDWLNVADGCIRNRFRVGRGTLGIGLPSEAGGSGLYVGVSYTIPFRRRRSVEQKADYSDIFKVCDSNTDDKLSLSEMTSCFPQPSRVLVKTFNSLDRNKDATLNLQEFENAYLNLGDKAEANCHTNMLQRCGYSFMLYSRARVPNQTTMCGALQEYIDCVGLKRKMCDTDENKQYTTMLSEMVTTTREDGICPNITIDDLGSIKDVNLNELPCSKSAIMLCDIGFMEDLHKGVDACIALDAYEKCLSESHLGCEDEPSEEGLKAAQDILKAYLSTGMCS